METLPEKFIMNEIKKKKSGNFSPREKEWYQYVADCLLLDMCPNCGNDIFITEEIIAKGAGKTIFSECSTCDWKNYDIHEPDL